MSHSSHAHLIHAAAQALERARVYIQKVFPYIFLVLEAAESKKSHLSRKSFSHLKKGCLFLDARLQAHGQGGTMVTS